jgi:hypothetical protein
MTGRAVAIGGEDWLADVVEHWPPGGPDDRPLAYDVFFYDPDDRHQWFGRPWVRADAVDLSADGLRRLARGATLRSWRDARSTYWRIRTYRARTIDSVGDGERMPDGIIAFAPRDAPEPRVRTRIFAELPPLSELGDEELERLAPRPDARTPLTRMRRHDRDRRSPGQLSKGEIPPDGRHRPHDPPAHLERRT